MTFSFSDFEAALKAGATMSAADILALRREIWPDGAVSDAEASALFDLNRVAGDAGPEWTNFFVEAMTEYVVNQRAPRGYVDEAAAAWLIAGIERDGAANAADLALVVKVLESALNCPASLKTWALGTFKGDYRSFHARIRAAMPPTQSPNLYLLGKAATFVKQVPFSV